MTDVPHWHTRAACRDADLDPFFPTRSGHGAAGEALRVCARCPVRSPCLEFALTTLTNSTDFGVWGGTTERERAAMRRERKRDAA